jgi:tRNA(Ile)-lysidine synthase
MTGSRRETGADVPGQVAAALDAGRLLEGVRRLGVAVSGGADSVAMLHLLAPVCRRRRIVLVALHLNHGLRGAASAGDAVFVRALCARLGIVCAVGSVRGLEGKRPKRRGACQSLEMAARAARQAFFRRAASRHRLDAVAVAHHRDDAAETVLLRLMRGAGAAGLSGMRPASVVDGLRVIRPLLGIGREDLRAWLKRRNQAWRDDASNSDLSIPRNRVRGSALPFLEETFGSGVAGGLVRSADLLREDDAALDALAAAAAESARAGKGLRADRLLPLSAALRRRVVYRWLLERGGAAAATFETVGRVLEKLAAGSARWRIMAGGGIRIGCREGVLSADAGGPEKGRLGTRFLRRNGTVTVGKLRVTVRATVGIVREGGPVGRLPARCTISAEAVRGRRLAVRGRRPGDRIAPLGMSGSRKVQDVLTDARIPAGRRDAVPLLVCGREVVWIPGYRVAARFAVPGSSAPALLITVA